MSAVWAIAVANQATALAFASNKASLGIALGVIFTSNGVLSAVVGNALTRVVQAAPHRFGYAFAGCAAAGVTAELILVFCLRRCQL